MVQFRTNASDVVQFRTNAGDVVQFRTNAGDVVQGGAGDDQRGREAQELRPQADEEESDRGDQAAAAYHEREGQSVSHFNLKNTVTEEGVKETVA